MTLTPGARLGPYEIVSALGAGGMGEVYKARDTRLDRTVAVKVLSSSLAADPQLRERFEREARTVSQLNHPHICTLHDVGRLRVSDASASQGGEVDFLVMEFIEGETLAARLERGALKIDDALKVAIEIASALDAAHRLGVVHRDLKPLNVMLTRSGSKLLDFGLAKIAAGPAGHATMLPTTPPNVTAPGTVLGTFQYMAPEQLEGSEADARSDIFAFGCVLYEMVTGRKAFEAKSQATLISAILRDDPPPIATLQPMAPGPLDRVVRTCLAKDPDERWQTAADLKRELTWIADERRAAGERPGGVPTRSADSGAATIAAASPTRALRGGLVWAAAGAVAGATIAGGVAWRRSSTADRSAAVIRATISVPAGTQLIGSHIYDRPLGGRPSRTAIALSPDGRTLAYTAAGADRPDLFIRGLDQSTATVVPGTRGADSPVFSPDGRWIAFWADGALRKVPRAGGPAVTIAETPAVMGADWAADDSIVFARESTGLLQVPASGGKPKELTNLDASAGEVSHRLPHVLPDGKTVLFTVTKGSGRWVDATIVALDRSTGKRSTLVEHGSDARYVATGHLLFARMGTLLAVPFDPVRREVRGGAVGMIDNVMHAINATNGGIETGAAQVGVSTNGNLVYVAGGVHPDAERSIVWVNRAGQNDPIDAPPGPYIFPRLSPDGRRIATGAQRTLRNENRDIWIIDLAGRATARLTGGGTNSSPAWTPDSRRVAFTVTAGSVTNLFWKAADGGGEMEQLPTGPVYYVTDWTPDGRSLLFLQRGARTGFDIWLFSTAEKRSTPIVQTPFEDRWPNLSPDGRWLAYASNETGRDEVYVQPFPGPGPRQKVSVNGGAAPLWSRNGRELFYLNYADAAAISARPPTAMVAEVKTAPAFSVGEPRALFNVENYVGGVPIRAWDVAEDGRLLMVALKRPTATVTEMQLVVNWFDELKARVAQK